MASGPAYDYIGNELTLFAAATHWADYLAAQVGPHVGGSVFEVGAGLGARTRLLCGRATRWVALEPDRAMGAALQAQVRDASLPRHVEAHVGTLRDLPEGEQADAVIYLDVLEHIEDDREELALAAERLRPGGRLVVLAPAHAWLYTAFDRAIGHHRRYTLRSLEAIGPRSLRVRQRRMLDSVGMLASIANRFLLRSAMPSAAQIRVWDRAMVPVSRRLDRLLGYRLGKSALMVWQRP